MDTVALKKRVLEALTKHKGIVSITCTECNIARSTFYDWKASDTEFAQGVIDANEAAIDYVENKLHELIEKKDTAATLFFLKCRAKTRGYVERQEVAPVDPNGNALLIPAITLQVIYPEGYTAPGEESAPIKP